MLCNLSIALFAQDKTFANYIQQKSIIKEGGTELFSYKGNNYMVSVVSIVVGTKSELDCKKVAQAKAKKEMISYVNGSEIVSSTELRIIEESVQSIESSKVEVKQEFSEIIKENVIGMINRCTPLCGWYSEDKSAYYLALYKSIQL